MPLTRFGISIEEELIEKFDQLIEEKGYSNRSEAIRDMIRERLVERKWQGGSEEVVGVITLSFSHDTREITDVLNDIQHKHFKTVISTTHVHLDEHSCVEVILVRDKARNVKKIADRLISIRGVRHGLLSVTSPHIAE